MASRWILGPDKDYYKWLIHLKFLSHTLCIQMHDVVMKLAMLQRKYHNEIGKPLQSAYVVTRQFQRRELPIAKTRLQLTDDNFFVLTKRLYHCQIRVCLIFNKKPDKQTLTYPYMNCFKGKRNESNNCTWRLLCRHGNCNILEKVQT